MGGHRNKKVENHWPTGDTAGYKLKARLSGTAKETLQLVPLQWCGKTEQIVIKLSTFILGGTRVRSMVDRGYPTEKRLKTTDLRACL